MHYLMPEKPELQGMARIPEGVLEEKATRFIIKFLKYDIKTFVNMNKAVFDFEDYRAYLQQALPVRGKERGLRTRLATALGCQNAFVSQVLSGYADFSLEHAYKTSRFLLLEREERDFFLLLVQRARAGSHELREHFSEKMAEIREKRREISQRVKHAPVEWTEADRTLYYSSWHYAAVHICLVTKGRQSRRDLAVYLKLPEERVGRVVADLQKMGLAKEEGGRLLGRYDRMHLPADAPQINQHHGNWRMQAIASLDRATEADLHYSLVMSASKSAVEELRRRILNMIQDFEPTLKAAADEDVYVFTTDLFSLR
jgi:uncharacterized protein (TIGR02147 family)